MLIFCYIIFYLFANLVVLLFDESTCNLVWEEQDNIIIRVDYWRNVNMKVCLL